VTEIEPGSLARNSDHQTIGAVSVMDDCGAYDDIIIIMIRVALIM
jgi:hypothetical protein